MLDVTKMNVSKADQLNAIDLAGGPMVAKITGVRMGNSDQPLIVSIDSWPKPWKPCKSVRRLLAAMWGKDAEQWVSRSLELYLDPTVLWAGEAVGGIRVKAASHIDEPFQMMLPKSSKTRERVVVAVLTVSEPYTIADLCVEHGITVEAIDAWLSNAGKPPLSEVAETKRNAMAAWLNGDRSRIATVRDFMDADLGSTHGGEE